MPAPAVGACTVPARGRLKIDGLLSGKAVMQSDPAVLAQLNAQLRNELTAINQYFLHARMLKQWGYVHLGKHEYDESIEEMKHADRLIERILMLDGLPNLQGLGKIAIGQTVPEVLQADLGLERTAQQTLKAGIAQCESANDYVSREILVDILEDTEEHVDWLETQLGLIDQVGLPNYLQSAMSSHS
jgi:bacterioferritin